MSLKDRMSDFSFEVISETKEPTATKLDKEALRAHIAEAKKALAARQFGDYWTAVNKAAALMGAAESEEADDEITDMINRKLGGPGTEE